jgi:molybdopterin-containing oxidoreductase family iron-sulfur binding subunit
MKDRLKISRRSLLKMAGAAGIVFLPLGGLVARAAYKVDSRALQGKNWAMVINAKLCPPGCTICSDTCHKTHNVPSIPDPRHEVKWIWQEPYAAAFAGETHPYPDDANAKRPYPVLCNHCENPSCVKVCPTKATFQRADGLIMMDYHRCIGCRYCMTACPYGARSFNFKDPRPAIKEINPSYPTRNTGVVEKCSFCDERLAVGKMPACVEACPTKALIFGDLADPASPVRKALSAQMTLQRKTKLGTKPKVFYIV